MTEDAFFARQHATGFSTAIFEHGAIPGIYKQIRESYITVIVPSPFPALADEDHARELYTVNDKREQERKKEREKEERRGKEKEKQQDACVDEPF